MNSPITSPEHANNVPLGILMNSAPFSDGHVLNTVAAASKRVKLAESGCWAHNTSEDVAEEVVFAHKVIERHISGGNAAPPVTNDHLVALVKDVIEQKGALINAITAHITARLAAAYEPSGSIAAGVSLITAACEPSKAIADAIADAIAASITVGFADIDAEIIYCVDYAIEQGVATATKGIMAQSNNERVRKANSFGEILVLPDIESPGCRQGTRPTMQQLGFAIFTPTTRDTIAEMTTNELDAISEVYGEQSFGKDIDLVGRRLALTAFLFG
jgi:hypothetical protein